MAKEKTEVFTHTALATFQNTDGEWCVAYIKFNHETGATQFEKATSHGKFKMEACERFKIAAVETGSIV
jgi:hypothetical protein